MAYSHAHRRAQQGTLENFFFLGYFKHNLDAENDSGGRFLKKSAQSGFLSPEGQVGVKKGSNRVRKGPDTRKTPGKLCVTT